MESTLNIEQARFNMVEQQIRPWDVLDASVLDLLYVVKREEFVPAESRDLAFVDVELPIGHGQVMFQPKLEARLLQALAVKKTDKILEVGAGSGYMAALLAAKGAQVTSVEIIPELAKTAAANLKAAGVANARVEVGDGLQGWSAGAPYDVIVVSGSVPDLPQALLGQLKVGGRLAAIVGTAPAMEAQIVTCTAPHTYSTLNLFETVVPPLQNAPQPSTFRF